MKRQDFRFFHRLRVRWAEVDVQKIVFNSHYLMYLDTALSDYWRAQALPYEDTLSAMGGDLYLKRASVEYHASAQMEEILDIGLRCARIGNSSLNFVAGVFRADKLLVTGDLVHVFADPATQTSRPVPQALREAFADYEAGKPVLRLEIGSWEQLGAAARTLREQVFVGEQGIGSHMVCDDADAEAVHAVAFNRLGLPVATGRLLVGEPGNSRIGRMAAHRFLRGSGLGRAVLERLVDAARERGDHEVRLHAQCAVEGFYARQGYRRAGEPFEEAGIPHIEMVKALA